MTAVYIGTQGNANVQDTENLVGLSGLEPPTSRLSGVRSNRLSYKPSVNSLLKYLGYFAIRLINASRLFRHVLRTSCPVALALMQVNLHRA